MPLPALVVELAGVTVDLNFTDYSAMLEDCD
jgi:hypothetical protein